MTRNYLLPRLLLAAGLVVLCWTATRATSKDDFPPIVNTQNPKDVPPTPLEALQKITVPPGFHVSLFAGDPDVRQPINMAFDDRGRLWVAECYTYAGKGPNIWDKQHRDRVLIFEDADNDGRFDKRAVFWDKAQNLSSVLPGFGGVWLLCAPQLLFIPDADGDGRPDCEPQVVLDGWAVPGVGHNIVNGLMWGPDGWLYGRHGIQATSSVGAPGTPESQRQKINCGIWRYHPTRKIFEVVCHGTTNPWGLDYDEHGQLFFTNNVNGHLWHVVPGAHYKRMYGEDFDPHLYELLDQTADHQHWDSGKSWTDSRDAKGKHGELGGGHSHVGAMIYLADNFPEHYRNTIFMCNTHGRRMNNDRLVRSGCGYIGVHGEDFFFANSPWFRGIDVRYGPDGGVYVSDWVDLGECHDNDGVHRTSGRIYKVTHGKATRSNIADVSKLSDDELVKLQLHKNDWFVRQARRNLQERAAAGRDMKGAHGALLKLFDGNSEVPRKLRAMWALYSTGGADEAWLRRQLGHENEHVRTWAVKLLVDAEAPSPDVLKQLTALAKNEPSGLVRLFLASALQRLPAAQRAPLAAALLSHAEDAGDRWQPIMLWYGVEPLVPAEPARAVELAETSQVPLVRCLITRRLTESLEISPEPMNALLKAAAASDSANFQLDILRGMAAAMRGWRKAKAPEAWASAQTRFSASASQEVKNLARDLGLVFGDGRALDELRSIVKNNAADGETRRAALKVLIDNRPDDLLPLLQKLVNDPANATAGLAIRGLAAYDHPDTPRIILGRYGRLGLDEKVEAVNTLASRPAYAKSLLQAVADGRIPRADVSAFHARQVLSLGDDGLKKQLSQVWGEVRNTPAEKRKEIERYKAELTPARLKKADLSRGRLVFEKTCATCHTLYGQGQKTGPDLTGSNRDNLDYLLENIVDPSAVVAVDFRMSVVELKSGRVVTGLVGEKTERTLAVQTQTERVVLERSEIEEIRPTQLSLMPDGLFSALSQEQVTDLVGYLMARAQVPLPPTR